MKRSENKRQTSIVDSQKSAFSGGIIFAILTLIVSIIAKITNSLGGLTRILMDLFGDFGYDITFFGIILGLIYSFVLGFVICYFYSELYNKLPSKIKKGDKKKWEKLLLMCFYSF